MIRRLMAVTTTKHHAAHVAEVKGLLEPRSSNELRQHNESPGSNNNN